MQHVLAGHDADYLDMIHLMHLPTHEPDTIHCTLNMSVSLHA